MTVEAATTRNEVAVPTNATRAWARVLVVVLLATLLVPTAQIDAWSTPLTLSETLDALEAEPSDADAEVVRSRTVQAPIGFSAVGATAPATVTSIEARASLDGQDWAAWEPMAFLEVEDGPDPGSLEDRQGTPGRHTELLWVGEATYLQIRVEGGDPEDVEVTVIDSMHLNDGPVQRHVETTPAEPADALDLDVLSRARWGADESLGSSTRSVERVHMGVVHHTAHTTSSAANTYSREQVPGLIRAMHRYHTVNLGWSDIGYNVIVDRFGTIWEGRKGGFTNGVVGAHAAGFNVGSFGVSVIGNFTNEQASEAAIRSLTDVIAVKSAMHGIDPTGTTTGMGDGSVRPTIIGHRDVGQTSCPGRIQSLLPQIRADAQQLSVVFPDVPFTSPHRGAIIELATAGVTSGCEANAYCPRDSLTRAQASTFVTQALELAQIPGSRFADVPADGLHAGAVNALAQRGWLIGYPDGTFRPWDQLTRGQLATLLARSLDLPLTTPVSSPYPDVSRFATHAPGIAALKEIGIRGDCGSGRFCADDIVLRDSTASFVNMVRKYGADVEAQITVEQGTAVDGQPTDTPTW